MIRFGSLAVTAAMIAGVFTFADAFAGETKRAPSDAESVEVASASGPADPGMQSSAEAARSDTCARKVKVVYGGLGEAQRAGCVVAIN